MKLFVCPFCGRDAARFKPRATREPVQVECQHCGALGPPIKIAGDWTSSKAEEVAALHWNTRYR